MSEQREGWAWPLNTRKAHYIVGGISLCGGWAYLGSRLEQGKDSSPDNCKACARKLAKLERRKDA